MASTQGNTWRCERLQRAPIKHGVGKPQNGRVRAIVVHQLRDVSRVIAALWVLLVAWQIGQMLHQGRLVANSGGIRRLGHRIQLLRIAGQNDAAVDFVVRRAHTYNSNESQCMQPERMALRLTSQNVRFAHAFIGKPAMATSADGSLVLAHSSMNT